MVRITVVDDDPELLDLIGEILQGAGYCATLINSAEGDVLDQICRSEPDVLMIDLRHGGDAARGWEIVQELRKTSGCEGLPVVVSSADLEALNRVMPEVQADGRIVPLQLPFPLDDLERSVKSLELSGRRSNAGSSKHEAVAGDGRVRVAEGPGHRWPWR